MTVSTTNNRIVYTGNGTTTVFAFPYKFLATADIKVYVAGVLQTSGYTVGTPSDTGANVTFSVAPAVSAAIVILSDPAKLQSTSLPSTGPFPAKSVESMADKLTLLVQRLGDLVSRSFTLSDADSSTASTTLPTPEAGKLVAWNPTATGLQNLDPTALATVVAFGSSNADIFTGTGAQKTFTLSANPGNQANLDVSVGGVTQLPGTDYTWTGGTTLTFASAPPNNAKILARYFQALPQGTTDSGASTFSQSGSYGSGTVGKALQQRGICVTDSPYNADLTGANNSTAAIQAAHNAAVAAGQTYGFAEVIFPAGTYVFTSLTWSPFVTIRCVGNVVLKSSITSGKGFYVSTLYGNWDTGAKQLAYNSSMLVCGGKLVIENTTGSGSNTATGIFFGDDGVAAYSGESLELHGVYLRGWSKSHRFGSHAYLLTFVSCQFRYNGDAIYNDVSSYFDRNERQTYINCTFAQNTNVITGDATCSGDFTFIACSFDYNTQILPNITQAMVINLSGGCHLETNTATPFFTVAGGSVNLNGYYVAWLGAGAGPTPIIAKVGASGFVRSRGMTALTPTSATLFELTSSSATLEADDDYRQLGGVAASYITNTGGGYVEQHFSNIGANAFLLGARGNVKVRATGVYTHEFTKTGVAAGATVDLFSVGAIASYASGRMTIQATSAGLLTVKVVDFALIGGGTVGGSVVTVAENYSGGTSAFTVSETLNSPSSGYNKISVTNNSAVTCSFTVSVQINYMSAGGLVTPL